MKCNKIKDNAITYFYLLFCFPQFSLTHGRHRYERRKQEAPEVSYCKPVNLYFFFVRHDAILHSRPALSCPTKLAPLCAPPHCGPSLPGRHRSSHCYCYVNGHSVAGLVYNGLIWASKQSTTTQQWPQRARAVMPAIQIGLREAIKSFL